MTDFFMKLNTSLKWVNMNQLESNQRGIEFQFLHQLGYLFNTVTHTGDILTML